MGGDRSGAGVTACKLIPALVRYDQHRHHEMAKGNTELGEVGVCV